MRLTIDQDNLEFHKVEERDVYDTIKSYLGGVPVGYSHKGGGRHPVEIAVQLPKDDLAITQQTSTTPVPANALPGERSVVELGDVVKLTREDASYPIFRHNGHAAEMVMAELAGAYEAPIYGMLAVDDLVAKKDWGSLPRPEIRFHGQPDDATKPVLLWDGEWEVTYVTFRDMGAAFAVASARNLCSGRRAVRLIQTAARYPHARAVDPHRHHAGALDFRRAVHGDVDDRLHCACRHHRAQLDPARRFHRSEEGSGAPLRQILLEAGAIRFKPILLTALAAMIGAAVILTDPIFQGLAISLLFGLASSTLLTVLVIPAIYIVMRDDGRPLSVEF